jgi:hypothetical protein
MKKWWVSRFARSSLDGGEASIYVLVVRVDFQRERRRLLGETVLGGVLVAPRDVGSLARIRWGQA